MATTAESVRALSYRDLQALAKSLNVKAIGRREELVERLLRLDENFDACPRTPETKCENTDLPKKEMWSTPAAPSTPSLSLAKALKKLPINTPRARATPRSHYKTRSVSKANRPPSPSKESCYPSAHDVPPTFEEEKAVPCSSPRTPRETKPLASAKRCTFTSPSTLSPMKTEEADETVLQVHNSLDTQNSISSTRPYDGTPGKGIPETQKREENRDYGCSPRVDSTDGAMAETVEVNTTASPDAEDTTPPPSRRPETISPKEATENAESLAACVKLFTDDPVECVAKDLLGARDGADIPGEETRVENSDVEGSPACVASTAGSFTDYNTGRDLVRAQGGLAPEEESGSVASAEEVNTSDVCTELSMDDTQDTKLHAVMAKEETGLDGHSGASDLDMVEDVLGGSNGDEDEDEDEGRGITEGLSKQHEEEEGEAHRDGGEKETKEEIGKCFYGSETDRNADEAIEPDTRDLVVNSGFLVLIKDDTRVLCTLTGDEILPTFDDVARHLDTQRVQELLAERLAERPLCADLEQHAEEGEEVLEGATETSAHKIDDSTRNLVERSAYLEFTEGEARVVCTLTGHEVKPDYMDIMKYLSSKRVQRLLADGPFDIEEYAGMFVVEDPEDAKHVICELTGARLFKCRQTVARHLNGQQYKKALEKLQTENQSR